MISVVKFQFSNLKLACESVWTVVSACDVTCFSEGATVPNLTEGKLRESDDVLKRVCVVVVLACDVTCVLARARRCRT